MKSFIYNKLGLENIYKFLFSLFILYLSDILYYYFFINILNLKLILYNLLCVSIVFVIIYYFIIYKIKNLNNNTYLKNFLKLLLLPFISVVIIFLYFLCWNFYILIFIYSNVCYFLFIFNKNKTNLENILFYLYINILFFVFFIYKNSYYIKNFSIWL